MRRTAAGAWHVPAGLFFLVRRPTLWGLAILPAGLAGALLIAGVTAGLYAAPSAEAALAPSRGTLPDWLSLPISVAVWLGMMLGGAILGFALALLLAAPLLDRLSRRVEAIVRNEVPDAGAGLRWEAMQSLRAALYFMAAAPGVIALGLLPLVGPPLAVLWGAHALSLQETDGTLSRRGFGFDARREWHRRWRPESLGFGLAGLVALAVPLANLMLAPALTVGATRLVLELEALATAAEAAAREPGEARSSVPTS